MPWRFRRTLKILPGFRLNVNKRGLSTSFGFRGFHITLGKQGIRRTVGLPGTGLSYTSTIGKSQHVAARAQDPVKTRPLPANPPPPPAALPESAIGDASWGSADLRRLALIGGGVVLTFGAIAVCVSSAWSILNPPLPPTFDVRAINTSAALTAWAPITQTAAVRLAPIVPIMSSPTPLPSPTLLVLPTLPLMPVPTSTTAFRTYPTLPPPTSGHPPGSSGLCNDGTYTYAQHSQGACSHHGGIKRWWGP